MGLNIYANMAAGIDLSAYTDAQMSTADVDGDGNVSITDATFILTYYAQNAAGIETSWETLLGK